MRDFSSCHGVIPRMAALSLLTLIIVKSPPAAPAYAGGSGAVQLALVGASGEPATLVSLREQSFVTAFGGAGAVVESIELGCRLRFVAEVAMDGTIAGDLELSCRTLEEPVGETSVRTPFGRQQIQTPVTHTVEVDQPFETTDGAPVSLTPVGGGCPVSVTPQVLTGTGMPEKPLVLLRILVPIEGVLPASVAGQFLAEPQLFVADGSRGELRHVDSRSLVTGHDGDTPRTERVETGVTLSAAAQSSMSEAIQAELSVESRLLEDPIAEFPLRTEAGEQRIQRPAVHTLRVETEVELGDGETLVLGGVVTDAEESLVLFTPRVVASLEASAGKQFLLEARIAEVGLGVGSSLVGALGTEFAQSLQLFSVVDRESAIEDRTERPAVSGFDMDGATSEILAIGSSLVATSALTGTSAVACDLAVNCTTVEEEVDTFRILTPYGNQKIEQTVLHNVHVDTRVQIGDGQTIVLGGLFAALDGRRTETLVFASPRVLESANPAARDQVGVEARILSTSVGGAPTDAGVPESSSLATLNSLQVDQQPGVAEIFTEDYEITGYSGREPIVSSVDTGCALEATAILMAGTIQTDLKVTSAVADAGTESFIVRTPGGPRTIQQPVRHVLCVDTAVDVADGETLVVGGVQSPQDEAAVFFGANEGTASQVVLESRVARLVRGSSLANVEQPDTPLLAELSLSAASGDTVTTSEAVVGDAVVDKVRGRPVVVPLETGFLLVSYTPVLLASGAIHAGLEVDWAELEANVQSAPQCRSGRPSAVRESVGVATSFEAQPGETVVLTSAAGTREVRLLATVGLVGEGAEQEVSLQLRLISVRPCK